MKERFISLLLILASVCAFSMGIVSLYQRKISLSTHIAIISDLHIVSNSYFTDKQSFESYANRDKLVHISSAIAHSVADEIISNKSIKTILVAGDITENGDEQSHKAAREAFAKLTKAGKQVFVINGNHDIAKSAEADGQIFASQFRKIYWDYGYDKAIERDDLSLSYVADIDTKFRLIAIDNDDYYDDKTEAYKQQVDARLLSWVTDQLMRCKKDKVTPLVMAHKPLVNHLGLVGTIIGKADITEDTISLANIIADNGCDYVFTGHLHGQHINYYTSEFGNRFLDILTASTAYYPNAYREIEFFTDKVTIKSKDLKTINMEYISPHISEAEYSRIERNFADYAYWHFKEGLHNLIESTFSVDHVMNLLAISQENRPTAELILQRILKPLLELPFYGEEGEQSVDSIIKENGGQGLPVTKYKNLKDLAVFFVERFNAGDAQIEKNSDELILLQNGIYIVFYLIDKNANRIAELHPNLPPLEIDVQRLFAHEELELLHSNLLRFVYEVIKDSLPSIFQNININNLGFIKSALFESLLNGLVPELGTGFVSSLGEEELYLSRLINDVIFNQILEEELRSDYPGDNNIVISRTTLEPV